MMHQFSPAVDGINDYQLVRRVRDAYKKAYKTFSSYGESQWGTLDSWKSTIHHLALEGSDEELTAALRDPASTELFYGFDLIGAERTQMLQADESFQQREAQLVANAIELLASAMGATRVNNPEAPDHRPPEKYTSQELVSLINPIAYAEFPNPFPNEFGLKLKSGVANLRAVFALYQRYRSLQVMRISNSNSILEIGAGLGRSAYYCHTAFVKDYTIIDLPLTNLAQGYFLGRTLGPESISLFGEERRSGRIQILPPICLRDIKADLVVNVDSLTEMDQEAATMYVRHALDTAKVFLSINHEVNRFTVNQLVKKHAPFVELMRYPAAMRPGYIEEIAFIRG